MSGDLCCTWPNCAHTAKDQCRWAEDAVIRKQAHIAARSVDADEITRLRAEVDRLTGERDRQYDQNAEQITRIAALEAEVERLRAALGAWGDAVRINVTMEEPRFMGVSSTLGEKAWKLTRAALEEKP